MQESFSDHLTRFDAVDGRQWDTGDKYTGVAAGKPRLSYEVRRHFEGIGIVHPDSRKFNPHLSPYEVAFTLTQSNVWQHIIENNIDNAIVLEDDCEPMVPGTSLFPLIVPDDAEVLMLTGPDTPGREHTIYCDERGRVVNGVGNAGGNLGYWITRDGAKKAFAVTFPMIFPADHQWHHTFSDWCVTAHFLPPHEKTIAYGSRPALIKSSTNSGCSDTVSGGNKKWLKNQITIGGRGV